MIYDDILRILNFQYNIRFPHVDMNFSKYYIYMKNNFCNIIFVFLELSNIIFYTDFSFFFVIFPQIYKNSLI